MWADAYVYVSHDLDEVQHICDRAVVLSAGRVIADAKVEDQHDGSRAAVPRKAGRMNPALAIAPKDLLVRDKGVLFWACVFPLAFGLTSLASGAVLASRAL